MSKVLIIQTSLRENSNTSILVNFISEKSNLLSIDFEVLDLRNFDLQMCNGNKIENYNVDMQSIAKKLAEYDNYILAYPVYNYSFSGVCKNFLDIFSGFMEAKNIGIVQNSGSVRSFGDGFSELSKGLSLHSDMKISLPLVHSCSDDFQNGKIINDKLFSKVEELLKNICED